MIVNFFFLFKKRDIAPVNIYVKIVDELLRLDKCDIKLVVELSHKRGGLNSIQMVLPWAIQGRQGRAHM